MHAFSRSLAVGLSLLTCLLCSCAHRQPPPRADATLIAGVPFYPDSGKWCGPAALATVLDFHGLEADPAVIAEQVYSEGAGGTLTYDMLWYARERGLMAEQLPGTFEHLCRCVEANLPPIVMVDFGPGPYSANHYMVITGYDETGFYANSGPHHSMRFSKQRLRRLWERHDNWLLVVHSPGQPLPW